MHDDARVVEGLGLEAELIAELLLIGEHHKAFLARTQCNRNWRRLRLLSLFFLFLPFALFAKLCLPEVGGSQTIVGFLLWDLPL